MRAWVHAPLTCVGQRGEDNATIPTEGAPVQQQGGLPTNHRVQIGEVVTTVPTIGFNVESVTYKNLNFNVWVRTPTSAARSAAPSTNAP